MEHGTGTKDIVASFPVHAGFVFCSIPYFPSFHFFFSHYSILNRDALTCWIVHLEIVAAHEAQHDRALPDSARAHDGDLV